MEVLRNAKGKLSDLLAWIVIHTAEYSISADKVTNLETILK
jgi:hypothetical protein